MQVGPITAAQYLTASERQVLQQHATAALTPLAKTPDEKKPAFEPAPALRPTVQDRIDFNRALLNLPKI